MSADRIFGCWSKLLDGDDLNDDERVLLLHQIENDSSVSASLRDDWAIHCRLSMLTESKTNHDSFVRQCCLRFERDFQTRAESSDLNSENVADSIPHSIPLKVEIQDRRRVSLLVKKRNRRSRFLFVLGSLAVGILFVTKLLILQLALVDHGGQNARKTDANDDPVNSSNEAIDMRAVEADSVVPDGNGLNAEQLPLPDLVHGMPDEKSELNLEEINLRGPIANIYTGETTNWKSEPQTGPVGQSKLAIESGFVLVQYIEGPEILVTGPADWEVLSIKSAALGLGKFLIETPDAIEEFQVVTNEFVVSAGKSTKLHIVANDRGTEIVLSSGRARLNSRIDSEVIVDLFADGLNHSFATASDIDSSEPSTRFVLAQGNGQYLAQLGTQNGWLTVDAPEKIEQQFGNPERDFGSPGQAEVFLAKFNEIYRKINRQFQTDNEPEVGASYSLQDEIFIDNGMPEFAPPSMKSVDDLNKLLDRAFKPTRSKGGKK